MKSFTSLKKNGLCLLFAASALLIPAETLRPATVHAAESAYVQLTFTNGGTLSVGQTGYAIVKKGTAYLPASTAETAGITVKVDDSGKRASFEGWNKSFAVRVGSRTGMLDGKSVDVGGVPFISNKQIYIPAKFLVKALEGGNVVWDAKKRTVLANGLHLFRGYSEKFEGALYSVSLDSGELYLSASSGQKTKLADLGKGLDVVDFTFERTPGGLIRLDITNLYGEPHFNVTFYTILLKDGAVLRQGQISGKTSLGVPAAWSGDRLLVSDGKTLRLIEDGTGRVAETVDLAQLMQDDPARHPDRLYQVVAYDPDMALIRPSDTGLLTLIDRTDGSSTLLYREFFDEERQKEVEAIDPMLWGDLLNYAGRKGNALTFTYNTGHGVTTYTHTLGGSAAAQ